MLQVSKQSSRLKPALIKKLIQETFETSQEMEAKGIAEKLRNAIKNTLVHPYKIVVQVQPIKRSKSSPICAQACTAPARPSGTPTTTCSSSKK